MIWQFAAFHRFFLNDTLGVFFTLFPLQSAEDSGTLLASKRIISLVLFVVCGSLSLIVSTTSFCDLNRSSLLVDH